MENVHPLLGSSGLQHFSCLRFYPPLTGKRSILTSIFSTGLKPPARLNSHSMLGAQVEANWIDNV